jgi:uncharacterized membrane protein YjjP (DUF1212 family)
MVHRHAQLESKTLSGSDVPDRERLVLRLALLMATYGIPAYRLEEAASVCARHLGLRAHLFATPTAVFAAIGDDDHQRTRLLRLEPGEVNLEKQSQVDGVLRDVLADRTGPAEALARLSAIVEAPVRYGPGAMVLAQAVASATVAVFFGGGWREAVGAGLVGFVVGVILIVAGRHRRMARLMDFAAGSAAAFLAGALGVSMPPMSATLVALAGVIVLLPGLTLTTAVAELAMKHLSAGTARLMGALIIFVVLGFGVAVGQRAALWAFGPAAGAPAPLGAWALGPALVLAPAALAVLFRASPKDLAVIIAAGVLGFGAARSGTMWLGPEIGACVGAFVVGLASNVWARWADRPSSVMSVPGIMLLVPGSLGFRSVDSFLHNETLKGVDSAFGMLLVAVGLVTGLLLAGAAVSPRRPL